MSNVYLAWLPPDCFPPPVHNKFGKFIPEELFSSRDFPDHANTECIPDHAKTECFPDHANTDCFPDHNTGCFPDHANTECFPDHNTECFPDHANTECFPGFYTPIFCVSNRLRKITHASRKSKMFEPEGALVDRPHSYQSLPRQAVVNLQNIPQRTRQQHGNSSR